MILDESSCSMLLWTDIYMLFVFCLRSAEGESNSSVCQGFC